MIECLIIINDCDCWWQTYRRFVTCVQIDHVINHIFFANHNKIQMTICILYYFNIIFIKMRELQENETSCFP